MFFHSGATEGINTFFKGLALRAFRDKRKHSFFFCETDHACVFNLKQDLELLGHTVFYFGVNKQGNFDFDSLLEALQSAENPVLNYTVINNETGVVWPWSLAEKLKQESQCLVHVDAVQLAGKINDWNKLSPVLDCFTFSGHKFGSLKGSGFSFVKKEVKLDPLIVGGSQQDGRRAGTENALSVYSLKLALEDLNEKFNAEELKKAKDYIEEGIKKILVDKGEIIAGNNPSRNLNTIFVLIHGLKAENLSMRFDMEGIDLSTGSACSSGIIKENRILMAMGYSKEESKSALRFSFSPLMTLEEAKIYLSKIEKVFLSILK